MTSVAGPATGVGVGVIVGTVEAAAAAAAVPGGTRGACAESELDVSADAGLGGGDKRRTTAGGAVAVDINRQCCRVHNSDDVRISEDRMENQKRS